MKINSNSSVDHCAEIGNKVIRLFKEYPINEDSYYIDIFKKLLGLNQDLIDSINRGGLHNDRKELDEIRDTDVRSIFYEVIAKCNRQPCENQKNALRIKKILDRYGMEITDYTYINETVNVRALLSDLMVPELSDERASIPDLNGLLANLQKSQSNFDLANMQLIEDKSNRKKTKSATVLAKELRDLINNGLWPYLQSMAMAKPTKYKAFADLLFTIIKNNNQLIQTHLASVKRKKEKQKVSN